MALETPDSFRQSLSIPIGLAQTKLAPSTSLLVGSIELSPNHGLMAKASLQVVAIVPESISSGFVSSFKTNAAVTSSTPFFTPAMVGSLILWGERQAFIESLTSETQVVVTTDNEYVTNPAFDVESGQFSISYTHPIPATPGLGWVYIGLWFGPVSRMPTGQPVGIAAMNGLGIMTGMAVTIQGPGVVSAFIVNNTTSHVFDVDALVGTRVQIQTA